MKELKQEGGRTFSKTLNKMVAIKAKNIPVFIADGRADLFKEEPKKKLAPVKKKTSTKSNENKND